MSSGDPILILCSPRSCSTVVCAMLGQHPQLYGFPELNLFVADTVDDLLQLASSWPERGNSYLTGLLRSIAELEFAGQSERTLRLARDWLSSRGSWSTKQTFDFLTGRVAPRIGIDKSPRTCLAVRNLERALTCYPRARLIHLTRHPLSTLRSMQANHLRSSSTLSSSPESVLLFEYYAELWTRAQRLILSVVQQAGPLQAYHVRAEDLIAESNGAWPAMLDWLGIDSSPVVVQALRRPELSPYARPAPLGMEGDGDNGFMQAPVLRPLSVMYTTSIPVQRVLKERLIIELLELSELLGYGRIVREG